MLCRVIEPALHFPKDDELVDTNSYGGVLEVSSEFVGYFIQLADLRPNSDVLDVGCAIGRMAYMLAHYLTPAAHYEGFDIVDRSIAWAQKHISQRFPNFTFQKSDIYSKFYNPNGTCTASEFLFPYEDESFDFIFLSSVFTHMLAPDVRHYLDEIQRVLRPGGRCLATYFLLNEDTSGVLEEGKTNCHKLGECYTTNPDFPEEVTLFEEHLMLRWISERGFSLKGKYYGLWCGRRKWTSFQDILVFRKTA